MIFVVGIFADDKALLYANFRPILDLMIQNYEQYNPDTASDEEKYHSHTPYCQSLLSSDIYIEYIYTSIRSYMLYFIFIQGKLCSICTCTQISHFLY